MADNELEEKWGLLFAVIGNELAKLDALSRGSPEPLSPHQRQALEAIARTLRLYSRATPPEDEGGKGRVWTPDAIEAQLAGGGSSLQLVPEAEGE